MEEIETKKPRFPNKHHMQAELIINPGSGAVGEAPVQLMNVISEMQAWKLVPEAYLVEPDSDLSAVVQKANPSSTTTYTESIAIPTQPCRSWQMFWR